MTGDYHIYIHGANGESQNKTKPFSAEQKSAFTTKNEKDLEDNATETGAAALAKVAPWVAVAIAVVKVADKVVSTGFSHLTEYTGHYEYEMSYNNFKTAVNHVFHPIGYAKQIWHRNAQWNKANLQIAEERELIGDTLYKNQKIGV